MASIDMAVYKDKRGRLFIQFRLRGQTVKRRLPAFISKKDAQRIEIKLRSQILFESHGIEEQGTSPTFEQFAQDVYLPFVEANCTKGWLDHAIRMCRFALKTLKGKKLKAIKPSDIEHIKAARMALPTIHGRKRSASTVVKEISLLSKLFSLAVKDDLIPYNPASRVSLPKIDNLQNKVLFEHDEQAFLDAFESEWCKDICILVLNAGLSQKDVLNLTKFNYIPEKQLIFFTRSKTTQRVEVPLNGPALAIIQKRMRLPGSLLFPSPKTGKVGTQTKTAIINACRRAGIPKLTIRDLRRTFGTRLHERMTDDKTVADLLGHADLRSVHRYKRGSLVKRTAVESLEKPANDAKILPLEKLKNVK